MSRPHAGRYADPRATAAALLLFWLGCGDAVDGGLATADLNGTWSGELPVLDLGTAGIELTLIEQSDGQISGSAFLTGLTTDGIAAQVTGQRSGAAVSLMATSDTLGSAVFEGDLQSNDRIEGLVSVSGVDLTVDLTLTRT